jgi:hypothetical protein
MNIMNSMYVKDAATASSMTFLVGELERLDPVVRQPLSSVTYPRDVRIIREGGWYEYLSTFNVNYGISGGVQNLQGGIQNAIARVQADLSKDTVRTSVFQSTLSLKWIDMQFNKMTGRNLQQLLEDGTRLIYDKYLEQAVYFGFPNQGIAGLVNHPSVTASSLAMNAGNTSTQWADKTPQEILDDVNNAINAAWAASEYDNSAIPNHILIPPADFTLIQGTIMSVTGTIANSSVLQYILNNNMATTLGQELKIYPCRQCIGVGAGSTDRMIVYNDNAKFLDFQIPVEIGRIMSMWNPDTASMDTLYAALVGAVRLHYTQPIIYKDGI